MKWLIWEEIVTYLYKLFWACKLHSLYKMWCEEFITYIILVAAEGLWHLGPLLYHDTQYSQLG
jgi:hypothetical protein